MSNLQEQLVDNIRIMNDFLRDSISTQLENQEKTNKSLDVISDYLKTISKTDSDESDKSTESNKSAAKGSNSSLNFNLKEIADSLPKLLTGLVGFEAAPTSKFTAFLRNLTRAVTNDWKIQNPKDISELYKSMSDVFIALGDSMSKMSIGLIVFGIADKMKAPDGFIKFMDKFFNSDRMKDLDPKKTEDMANALASAGKGILIFSVAMAISAPLLILAIPALLLMYPITKLLNFVMKDFSKSDDIQKGANALMYMGVALLTFSVSLMSTRFLKPTDLLMGVGLILLFSVFILTVKMLDKIGGKKGSDDGAKSMLFMSGALIITTGALLITRLLEPEDIIKGLFIMAGLAGVSLLLGLAKDKIKDGGISLLFISGALIIATLGIMLTRNIGWEDIGKAGAIIGGLGLTAFLIGIRKEQTLLGAFSLIVVSAALIVAGVGIGMVSKFEWEDIGKAGAVIGGLGAAAFLVGLGSVFSIMGAGVILVTSAALIVAAKGLAAFKVLDMGNDELKSVYTTITGLGKSFAKVGLLSPFILAGSAAVYGIGSALNRIGEGLLQFSKLDIPLDEMTGKDGSIYKVLSAVMIPFAEIGKENSVGGGFLNLFGSNPVAIGIKSVRGVGDALIDIAKGVQGFANLTYTDKDGKVHQITESEMTLVGNNIKIVVGAIGKVFAELGESNGETNWFKKGKIENGIKSIDGVGNNLVGILKTVQGFANLTYLDENGKKQKITEQEMLLVGKNIKLAVTSLTDVLSEIGAGDSAKGNWFKSSDIDKGKKAISNISNGLSNVLDTISKMSKYAKIDTKSTTKYLSELVTDLTSTFGNKDILNKLKLAEDSSDVFSDVISNINKVSNLNVKSDNKFKDITSGIISIANSHKELKSASFSIEKISKSLISTFDAMNKLADDKLTKAKEFFQTLVEVEKMNEDSFNKKITSLKEIFNNQQNIVNNIPSKSITNESSSTYNNKLEEKFDILSSKFDQLISLMTQMNGSLNRPLMVDIIDDDVNRLMNR